MPEQSGETVTVTEAEAVQVLAAVVVTVYIVVAVTLDASGLRMFVASRKVAGLQRTVGAGGVKV